MLFLIRETLIINWGRGNISVLKANTAHGEATTTTLAEGEMKVVVCRDFFNCEYCNCENDRRRNEFYRQHGSWPVEVVEDNNSSNTNGHATNGHANGNAKANEKAKKIE